MTTGNGSGIHANLTCVVPKQGKYIVFATLGIRGYVSKLNIAIKHNNDIITPLTNDFASGGYSHLKTVSTVLTCLANDSITACSTDGNVKGDDAHALELVIYEI